MLKRFDFFTRSLVTNDGIALDFRSITAQHKSEGFQADDYVCCSAGGGKFALGDSTGGITLMGSLVLRPKRFNLVEETISTISIQNEYLILSTSSCQVKVFKISDFEEAPPKLINRLNSSTLAWKKRGLPPLSPTVMNVTSDMKNIALGFRDGYVLWIHIADIKQENTEETFQWLSSSNSGACTALGFTSDSTSLWVGFEKKLSVFNENGSELILDREEGCQVDCGSVAPDPSFFFVGKQDRIAFYTTETAGSCYSILGGKHRLVRCRDHIVVVSKGEVWQGIGNNKSNKKEEINNNDINQQKQTVQILDLQNKYVAHEFPLWRESMDSCAFIAGDSETGCIFILTKEKKRLWRLQEKPIEVKLDDLLKRNLYSMAATIARSSGCEAGYVADIHRRYGDHLYEKGSYDDAISQFVLTVGRVEPSYVIKKFLDPPRIKNLVAYLETLHRVGQHRAEFTEPQKFDIFADSNKHSIPSADHTTLLLTCYAKLKEEEKINQLLQSQDARVDVDAALAVLKETGRLVPALRLAKERSRDAWYVQTLLELSSPTTPHHALSALEFIQKNNSVDLFRIHYSNLISMLPSESLNCVKYWMDGNVVKVEDVLDCFSDFPNMLELLCKKAIATDGDDVPSILVWNTALELTLSQKNLETAFELLTHPRANFDSNFALTCVRRFHFRKGELFLHEKSQQWDLLLSCKMEDNDDDRSILHLAQTRLANDSDSWMCILRHFSTKPPSPERDASIRDALRHIEQFDVLPPLLALRVLSEKGDNGVNLGVVRPYLIGQIERAARQAEADQAEVRQLREDTERMRREAHILATEPKVFNVTTCCMTGAPLELPVVHFLSGNSYNLSSLPASNISGDKFEDPKCAQDQHAVFDIARGLAKRRLDVDEEFFSELELIKGGESGFGFIADYFGKCLFDED